MNYTIRTLRHRLAYSQKRLAESLDVSLATVQRWEREEKGDQPRQAPRTALLATLAILQRKEGVQ